MTRFLVATDGVHATAAACDYLQGRLSDDDTVLVVAVATGEGGERDAADALNVVAVRLPGVDTETATVSGDPVTAVLDAAADFDAAELVVGSGAGETARRLVDAASIPVVVVPADG